MLLDTSGLFAYLHRDEIGHQAAQDLFKSRTRTITHSLVLAEFVTLASSRGFSRGDGLRFLNTLVENPRVEIIWVGRQEILDGLKLLGSRMDKTYSLCDAISFLLMNQRGVREALTADAHFVQEGFVALLR